MSLEEPGVGGGLGRGIGEQVARQVFDKENERDSGNGPRRAKYRCSAYEAMVGEGEGRGKVVMITVVVIR